MITHTASRKGAWHVDRIIAMLGDGARLQELRSHGKEETVLLNPDRG